MGNGPPISASTHAGVALPDCLSRRLALARMAAGAGAVAAIGSPRVARALPDAPRQLIVVMMRGAVDGLSVVVPDGDSEYRRHRETIAIAPSGAPGGAIPLEGPFGLHPSLAPLMPLWRDRRLAFVHACGSPDPTRSHFDAQDHLETATPGRRTTPEGWINRLLAEFDPSGTAGAPVRGVNLGTAMPRILSGSARVASLPVATQRPSAPPDAAITAALDGLYRAETDLASAWATLRETRQAFGAAEPDPGMDPGIAPGAVPLGALLARDAERLGRLMRRDPHLRAAFFSVGGWDTHVNQGGATGMLALRLGALAGALVALARGLDDRLEDTVILVVSEFGRTVRENGTRGTDHGHGNVMWVLGGPIETARVAGPWPGLDGPALYQGRDLAVTTDFRQVLAEVLERHLRLDDRAIGRILPDGPGVGRRPGVIRG